MQTNDITRETASGARHRGPDPKVFGTRRATKEKSRAVAAPGSECGDGKIRPDGEAQKSAEVRRKRCRYGAGF